MMINQVFRLLAIMGAIALSQVDSAEINVFAAASLTDALQDLGKTFESQTGDKVIFNFAASSLLARQISEHAPADVFFSADEAKMDGLQKTGLIATETRKDLLSNSLVIVVPADSTLSIKSAEELDAKTRKIAVADPRAVPAGIYTKEYLDRLGLWTKLEPKIVPTENVRAALAAVESGNVEAGFVYKTDANISKKVKIAFSVPADQRPAIRYPIAILKEAKNKGGAEDFLRFLESEDSRKMFERYGFIVKF
jgi:molybdate transport system substrate-binding protein